MLHAALQNHPQSYSLLHVQCDFLRTKDKHEWALKLAKQAVNCAPSEFVTWAKLTEVNMELGRFSDVRLWSESGFRRGLTWIYRYAGPSHPQLVPDVHLQ